MNESSIEMDLETEGWILTAKRREDVGGEIIETGYVMLLDEVHELLYTIQNEALFPALHCVYQDENKTITHTRKNDESPSHSSTTRILNGYEGESAESSCFFPQNSSL